MRMLAQGREQLRVSLVDLLEREPPRLLHQVHQPEVAGAENDHLAIRDVVLRALALCPVASPSACPTIFDCSSPSATSRHGAARQRPLDEVGQAVAVPLLEGGALGLAVVRQHDDLVRPRCEPERVLDPAELLVELAQRLERVGAFEARVVRDLVVARERRVDRGTAFHHVRDHAVHDQIADEDAHRRAQERVDAAAMAARAHVAADRTERREPLEDHLPGEEHEDPRDVEAVRQEGAIARVRTSSPPRSG